ncbi:MAG: NTP/NDP exchange transporter [Rhodospirillaceae bacterium]
MSDGSASGQHSVLIRLLQRVVPIEPHEVRAVVLGFLYYFFLLGSYYILRPVREAMGTTYGPDPTSLSQLYTGTFIGTLIVAPLFATVANRIKLQTLVPWIYGFIVITLLGFFLLFRSTHEDRWIAAGFYVWVSVFNMLITSLFWSFMADLFSRTQAKRLYGLVAAGGSAGAVAGPTITALLVKVVGTNPLLLIAACGFAITIGIVLLLVREKERLRVTGNDPQRTKLDHTLTGNPFKGFGLVAKSPYLLGIAAFVLFMTWVSTIIYFMQQDLIAKLFETREARTQAFALVELIVNVLTIVVQVFGTGRLVARFGVTTGLMLNPLLMMGGFVGVALAPVLLLAVQVVRRVSEYGIARPSREMLFTVVDQESKYKAKNVIDTVVYRAGDFTSAWIQSALAMFGLGAVGVAGFGVAVCGLWAWVALRLGRRYENVTGDHRATRAAAAAAE